MNAGEAATTIKNELASVLPALLTSASLADFEVYQDEPPRIAEQRALCVYVANETFSQDMRTVGILIQAQLYQIKNVNAYHDVIMSAIINNLGAELVGMQNVETVDADIWPFSRNVSSSFAYYELTYISDLDDCYTNV